jgi:hypothetical protein
LAFNFGINRSRAKGGGNSFRRVRALGIRSRSLARPCALQHLYWLRGFIDLGVIAQQRFAVVLFSRYVEATVVLLIGVSHEELRDVDDRQLLDK